MCSNLARFGGFDDLQIESFLCHYSEKLKLELVYLAWLLCFAAKSGRFPIAKPLSWSLKQERFKIENIIFTLILK